MGVKKDIKWLKETNLGKYAHFILIS